MRTVTVGMLEQLALLTALDLLFGLGLWAWAAGLLFAAAVCAALYRARVERLGPANHVTLARATLVGGVTALVVDGAPTPVLVTVASVALAMDAVDGAVARRTGTATRVGARFDLEIDAFLILVLSARVAVALGPWVLAIGAYRYLFVAASRPLPWLRRPLPPSRASKAIAATQGVVLVVAASDVLPRGLSITATALALAALTWSFARDVRRLHRDRG